MSLVVNMQQRRTVAAGRQNQDPNTVTLEEEQTRKQRLSPQVEKSIQEVLNHTRNTTGRGRQMVLAALQKKMAAETKSPPAAVKTSHSGRNLLGGSAPKNGYSGTAPSAVVMTELNGNKLSISDIRKRYLDQEEPRAPLSAVDSSAEAENDWTDWTVFSPAKPSPKVGSPAVYKKRQKTGTTPHTPSPRSSGRRQVYEEASPPPPPVFESSSADLRNEEENPELEASIPTVEQVAEMQPVRRQLMSPSTTQEESDLYGYSSIITNVEEGNPLALLKNSETQVLEVEKQTFSFIPTSPRRMHGLMNLGNTCYMNVIIQCLYNLSSFVSGMERFFGPLLKENIVEGSESLASQDGESVHAALLKVFRDLKQSERYDTVDPSVLKHTFAKHQTSFYGCIQQDAHEFFCSLIDQVQEDVSFELKKQYSIEADRPKLETVCPTTQNFSCSVRNNLTCAGCGNVSSVEETYRDFCLALPEDERIDGSTNCSLESLLNLYFQETTMDRKCEKCGVEDAKAQAQILKLPHVLVLQLKRLHMDRDIPCTKVTAPVKFTLRLDIGPWCAQGKKKFWSPSTDDVQTPERMESVAPASTTENGLGTISQGDTVSGLASSFELESQELNVVSTVDYSSAGVSTSYRLYGVVNHLGITASGGHFLADTLDPEADRWLRCDDSLVTDASEDSVLANVREAYMFFYVHESVIS